MSDLTCREFVESITALLDDELADLASPRHLDHAAQCPGCSRFAAQIQQTIAWIGALRTPATRASAASRTATEQTRRRLEAAPQPGPGSGAG